MAVSPSKQALSQRDPNTSSPTKPSTTSSTKVATEKVKKRELSTMAQDNSLLFSSIPTATHEPSTQNQDELAKQVSAAHATGQTYVSPSDELMSPTTKKLSEIRGKRFANAKKGGQSLFAKTLAKEGYKSQEKLNAMTSGME